MACHKRTPGALPRLNSPGREQWAAQNTGNVFFFDQTMGSSLVILAQAVTYVKPELTLRHCQG
jgi:hypothetical protein